METLVVVTEQRNHQYYSRVKGYKPAKFGCSSPTSHFREINCRTFQSAAGILPTPFKTCISPVTLNTPTSNSRKTPSPATKTRAFISSSPISISNPAKGSFNDELGVISENSSFSERWAGPAYSNSPPPSSLPIPKFSMRPKRTVSLDLPLPVSDNSEIDVYPIAKSAPASPTREHNPSKRDLFLSVDSATKTLRRILNLDMIDDEI